MIALLSLFLACSSKKPSVEPVVTQQPTHARQNHTRPAPLEKKSFQIPSLDSSSLSNDIPVFVNSNQEVPLVRIWFTFDAGDWSDPDDQIGLAQATMDMLDEGSQELSSSELSQKLRALGSSLTVQSGTDGSVLRIQSLKQNLDETLSLVSHILQKPLFAEEVWERKKKEYKQTLAQKHTNPRSIARNVWAKLLYGDLYIGRLQKEEHIDAITTKTMQEWHQNYIHPKNTQIWVGGATSSQEITPILEQHFSSWNSQSTVSLPKKPSVIDLNEPPRSFVYFVDIPGSAQSSVQVMQGILTESHADSTALKIANQAIGGMFTARINQNLREEKGWTYGAYSWLSYNYLPGSFNVGSSVVTKHTSDAVREIIRELRDSKSKKPITQQELERAKGDLLGTFPTKFEKSSYLINSQMRILRYDLPQDWLSSYESRISAIDLNTAQDAWNKYIDPETMFIVVVGDHKSLAPLFNELGYTVIPIDTYGTKLNP